VRVASIGWKHPKYFKMMREARRCEEAGAAAGEKDKKRPPEGGLLAL
jgi:hypothetical protein